MNLDRVLNMDFEWCLYHVVHDSPEFKSLSLDVDFYDDDTWSRLLASLPKNSTITTIKVERHQDGEGERTFEELRSLFRILSKIPSIESLTFSAAQTDDFIAALPLLRHPNLQTCHLDWTGITYYVLSVPDEIGTVLSEAPLLKKLTLEDPVVQNCGSWLSSILKSKSLKSVRIQTYHASLLDFEDSCSIFGQLENNSVLEEFSLGYGIDKESSSSLASMIRKNKTLKSLHVTILHHQPLQDDKLFLMLLEALKTNETLLSLVNHAAACRVSSAVEKKQQEMLEANNHIHSLCLFQGNGDLEKTKHMYLKLNAAGRHCLFLEDENGKNQSTPLDWINVLAGTQDSLDCIYHCLSMNPSLCKAVVSNEVKRPSVTGKRKRSDDIDAATAEI